MVTRAIPHWELPHSEAADCYRGWVRRLQRCARRSLRPLLPPSPSWLPVSRPARPARAPTVGLTLIAAWLFLSCSSSLFSPTSFPLHVFLANFHLRYVHFDSCDFIVVCTSLFHISPALPCFFQSGVAPWRSAGCFLAGPRCCFFSRHKQQAVAALRGSFCVNKAIVRLDYGRRRINSRTEKPSLSKVSIELSSSSKLSLCVFRFRVFIARAGPESEALSRAQNSSLLALRPPAELLSDQAPPEFTIPSIVFFLERAHHFPFQTSFLLSLFFKKILKPIRDKQDTR